MPWLISCLSNPLTGATRRTSRRRILLTSLSHGAFGGAGGFVGGISTRSFRTYDRRPRTHVAGRPSLRDAQ